MCCNILNLFVSDCICLKTPHKPPTSVTEPTVAQAPSRYQVASDETRKCGDGGRERAALVPAMRTFVPNTSIGEAQGLKSLGKPRQMAFYGFCVELTYTPTSRNLSLAPI